MTIFTWFAIILSLASCCYVIFAMLCVRVFASGPDMSSSVEKQNGITVLKPLCGLDPELLENLRSCCRQQYPVFQIIFGVMNRNDPAIAIVQQVIEEFPQLDLELVINKKIHGANLKVSNLINMYAAAKYDFIVIADSDMRVTPEYLNVINNSLQQDSVGMVTCLYFAVPFENLPSRLGAIFINEWFFPSVLVTVRLMENRYCFGATMAVRRQTLEKSGGFNSLVDYLADDYMLGKQIIELGMRIRIAPIVVENVLHESSFKSLYQHELRWARTMRTVQPIGYAFSFLTDALPLSLLAALFIYLSTGSAGIGMGLIGFALLTRCLLHFTVNAAFMQGQSLLLLPVRDLFTFVIRVASHLGRKVEWRKQSLNVQNGSHVSVKS